MTIWDDVLAVLRTTISEEDFRRWFSDSAYASDAGDQIVVWVSTEAIRRHVAHNYQDAIDRALRALGRPYAHVRFRVGGTDEDDDVSNGG